MKLKKPMKLKETADGSRTDVLRKSGGRSESKRQGRKRRKVLTAIDDDSVPSLISFLETASLVGLKATLLQKYASKICPRLWYSNAQSAVQFRFLRLMSNTISIDGRFCLSFFLSLMKMDMILLLKY